MLLMFTLLTGCGGVAGQTEPSEEPSIADTASLPETDPTTPPNESADSGGPGSDNGTSTPQQQSRPRKFAIRFGSPYIPGGGADDEPKTKKYKNEYRYAETVKIVVPETQWEVTANSCGLLQPGESCQFTLVFHPSKKYPEGTAEIWAEVESLCQDKLSPPCSSLPPEANPTPQAPVLAVWKEWTGRLSSHPFDY